MIKNKKASAEYIHRRARELAESVKYDDYMRIKHVLRHESFREARQILDSRILRQELNEMCKLAHENKKAHVIGVRS